MSAAIVRVDFHGDTVECVRDDAGKVWVALAPICSRLDLNVQAQSRKLKELGHMVRVAKIATRRSDGQESEVWAVDLDGLPAWLMSISLRRVADGVRDALTRYQAECAAVLRDHFFGSVAQPEPTLLPPVASVETYDRSVAALERAKAAGAIDDRGLALRQASLLKAHLGVDIFAAPVEGFAALPEVAALAPGESLIVTKPVDRTGHYSATELGAPYGLSAVVVGKLADASGVKGVDAYGKWSPITDGSGRVVNRQFLYNNLARDHLRPLLGDEQARRRSSQRSLGKRGAT